MEGSVFRQKAQDFENQAEKVLKGSFFGNLSRSKQDRKDEAKDIFKQAANSYKLCKDYDSAVRCFQKCISCEEDETNTAEFYREAAACVKETDIDQYYSYIKKAIDLYALGGRGSTGGNIAKECAQILEENYDYDRSIEMYQKAAQLYQHDNNTTSGNMLLIKLNYLKLIAKKWEDLEAIIKTYQNVAKKYLSTPLLKSSAKDLLFLQVLCFLAMQDIVGAKKCMQMSSIDDPNFDNSREQILLEKMIQAIEEKQREQFQMYIAEYNNITPFDTAKTSLLVRIKDKYLPEDNTHGYVTSDKDIDFTGATDDQLPNVKVQQVVNQDDDIDFR